MENTLKTASFINYRERLLMLIKEGEQVRTKLEELELPAGLYEALNIVLQTLKQALITLPLHEEHANNNIAEEDLILQEEWLVRAFLESFEELFQSILQDEEEIV